MKINLIKYDCSMCKSSHQELLYEYKTFAGPVLGLTSVSIVKCKDCNFIYNSPRPTKILINQHYGQSSSGAVYHEMHEGSRHSQLDAERSSFIEKYAGKFENGKIIDIGCGQGTLVRNLKLPKIEKYGLDPIQDKTESVLENVTFINGFIETYEPRADEKYDILTCISSLEHYYDPEIVIKKFNKMLNDDGLLFIEVPDTLNPKGQLAEFFSYEHLSHFTQNSLTAMLTIYGFEVIEFDKNVSIPNLRVVAKKCKAKETQSKYDDVEDSKIKNTFRKYQNDKNVVVSRMSSILKPVVEECIANNKSIYVYGAGDHTVHLFSNFNFIEKHVINYIDSDPNKWKSSFRDRVVIAPESIKNITNSVIIISSHDYESEIYRTIKGYNDNSLDVVCLYN